MLASNSMQKTLEKLNRLTGMLQERLFVPIGQAQGLRLYQTTTPPSTGKEELRLNLNEASKEELMEIPGIGEVLAQRILDFRQMYGPFYSVDELDEVDGIGEKRLEDLRRYLFVEEIK